MASKTQGHFMKFILEFFKIRLEFERLTKSHVPVSFESCHLAEWVIIKHLICQPPVSMQRAVLAAH